MCNTGKVIFALRRADRREAGGRRNGEGSLRCGAVKRGRTTLRTTMNLTDKLRNLFLPRKRILQDLQTIEARLQVRKYSSVFKQDYRVIRFIQLRVYFCAARCTVENSYSKVPSKRRGTCDFMYCVTLRWLFSHQTIIALKR